MNCIPTAEGLRQTRNPYIKWDTIKIEIGTNKVFFLRKGTVVAFLKLGTEVRSEDIITLTSMSGKVEVNIQ